MSQLFLVQRDLHSLIISQLAVHRHDLRYSDVARVLCDALVDLLEQLLLLLVGQQDALVAHARGEGVLAEHVLHDVVLDLLVERRDQARSTPVLRNLHARRLTHRAVLLRLLHLLECKPLTVIVLESLDQFL